MSIFHTNHRVDSAFRYVSEVAQTPVPETLVEDARRRVWQRLHASIAEGVENRDWDMVAELSGDRAATLRLTAGMKPERGGSGRSPCRCRLLPRPPLCFSLWRLVLSSTLVYCPMTEPLQTFEVRLR